MGGSLVGNGNRGGSSGRHSGGSKGGKGAETEESGIRKKLGFLGI